MALPGVDEAWTAPAVSRFACLTVDSSYWDDPECSYPIDTPRLATEVFDGNNTSTPAPGSTAHPAIAPTVSGSSVECLLGFALQGLDPFESTEWVGLSVCDGWRAGCNGATNVCSALYSSTRYCFWSIVDDGSDADDDGACSCQSCGGLPSDMDEYMAELPIWDRARCAIYALEITGYDVTPCVEALVDGMALPGVDEVWTTPAVSRFACLAVDSSYWDDPECSYPADTSRLATEVFDGNDTSTPAPGSTASPVTAPTISELSVECLLGFALQGLDPFERTKWVGLPVCDGSRAGCEVVTNVCSALYSTRYCFWSIVDDGSDVADDGACSCQSCGGLPSDMNEYMAELPIWDRAQCAIYALEIAGYDVTPCVEALVDGMALPGVDEAWTAPAVSRFACLTVDSSYWDDPECSYPIDTPRLATEVFDGNDTSTPAPGSTACPAIAPTILGSSVECFLGFALQGLDPFESTEWVGLSVCDGSRAGCNVATNVCSALYSSTRYCFWSIVDDGSDADDDGACSCQSCGGLPSDMDEYRTELSVWDRARCAIYALEITGYDVTPCVEALVDDMALPGVDEAWTAPAVSRFAYLTVDSSYWDDPECSYPADTPRLATEVFISNNTSTPAPATTVDIFATPGPAKPPLDAVKTTPWPTTAPSGIKERTLNPSVDGTAERAAHPSYSRAESDGTFGPMDAGSLDPLGVSPSESLKVSSSGPMEIVYSGPVGGSSGVTAGSSSSTSESYPDAVNRSVDAGDSSSSDSSENNVFEITIGIASVLVAIAGIIVGVRYRT